MSRCAFQGSAVPVGEHRQNVEAFRYQEGERVEVYFLLRAFQCISWFSHKCAQTLKNTSFHNLGSGFKKVRPKFVPIARPGKFSFRKVCVYAWSLCLHGSCRKVSNSKPQHNIFTNPMTTYFVYKAFGFKRLVSKSAPPRGPMCLNTQDILQEHGCILCLVPWH